MFGIEMLLKNLGLDPEVIKSSVESFGQVIVDMKAQMDRIENKLDAVLSDTSGDKTSPAVPLIGSQVEPLKTETLKIVSE
jgi:hypothetical protein